MGIKFRMSINRRPIFGRVSFFDIKLVFRKPPFRTELKDFKAKLRYRGFHSSLQSHWPLFIDLIRNSNIYLEFCYKGNLH